MTIQPQKIEGLDSFVAWVGIDPADWRSLPTSTSDKFENDEDHPADPDVVSVLGFDPDEFKTTDE